MLPSFIKHPRDFWTGVIFLTFGLAAVVIGQDYPMGTAGRMGPAYFPVVLGALLSLIGLGAAVRSFVRPGEPIEPFALREMALILASILVFGAIVRGAGLVAAVTVLVLMSAFASPRFNLPRVLALAAGLSLFSVVVFVKLLGLPLSILGVWFGF